MLKPARDTHFQHCPPVVLLFHGLSVVVAYKVGQDPPYRLSQGAPFDDGVLAELLSDFVGRFFCLRPFARTGVQ